MEDTGIEIDLYADMDSEFPKEEFKTEKNNLKEVKTEAVDDATGAGSEGSELYDNVLININIYVHVIVVRERTTQGPFQRPTESRNDRPTQEPAPAYYNSGVLFDLQYPCA